MEVEKKMRECEKRLSWIFLYLLVIVFAAAPAFSETATPSDKGSLPDKGANQGGASTRDCPPAASSVQPSPGSSKGSSGGRSGHEVGAGGSGTPCTPGNSDKGAGPSGKGGSAGGSSESNPGGGMSGSSSGDHSGGPSGSPK